MRPAAHFLLRGAILAALFAVLAAARFLSDAPLRPPALILVALGMAWRLFAGAHIAGHSNSLRLGPAPLAVTGPYALGRHPLYLANVLIAGGLVAFANALPAWGGALLFGAAVLHHARLAALEERHLAALHGEAWTRYREATPRWLGLPRGASRAFLSVGDGLAATLRRQGLNLAKPAAAALALGALALA